MSSKNYETFQTACETGDINTVKFLVKRCRDIHEEFILVNSKKCRGLQKAAKNGYVDVVQFLLEKRANPLIKNKEALRLAIKYGRKDVIEILKSNGCFLSQFKQDETNYKNESCYSSHIFNSK